MTKTEIKALAAGELTREQAIQIGHTYFWKDPEWSPPELALLQLRQERCIMDFGPFQLAVEKLLNRPVYP